MWHLLYFSSLHHLLNFLLLLFLMPCLHGISEHMYLKAFWLREIVIELKITITDFSFSFF